MMVVRNELGTAARVEVVRHALRARRFPEPGFAALTRLAASQLGVRTAVVTLLDDTRQHFAAGVGLPRRLLDHGMPAHRTYCHEVLRSGAPVLIDDTVAIGRPSDSPDGLTIRAYAGFPIVTSDGFVLGAFCAAHDAPRSWSDGDRALLERLADATAAELEVRAELAIREDDARAHDPSLSHEGMLATAPDILASITDAFVALDRAWRFTWVNAAAEELLGAPADALVGRLAWAELPGALAETLLPHLEGAVESGRPLVQDDPFAIGARWFTLRAYPARHGISVFLRDVTARIESEAAIRLRDDRLRQAQKMEALGLLTGGVAHDFNNILTVIQGNADVLAESAADVRDELREIQRAAERAGQLTRQLLAFSRKQVLQPRVLDPNEAIASLLPMLRRLIPPNVRIDTALAHEIDALHCDPGQLEQVLLNLAVNARDAMPRGGVLRLATMMQVLDAPRECEHATIAAGRWVTITVSDSGIGIAAPALRRIFEPFFTTKAAGTGLGLATAYGIVDQSGGAITVSSRIGHGTEFTLWFPPVAAAVERPGAEAAPDLPLGRGVVLVVDDEAGVRSVVERSLRALGYTVLACADAEDALAVLETPETRIDLLLSDIQMPGVDGSELVRTAQRFRPGLPGILMSGYAESMGAHAHLAMGDAGFLQKPFKLRQLAEAVHLAIGTRAMSP